MIKYKTTEELMRDREFIGLYDKEEADRIERRASIEYQRKLGFGAGFRESYEHTCL